MTKGYFTLVLHSHMPYVHHLGSDAYIEERWLFEAITETYLPLLQSFERLTSDSIPFRVTMSISPTLLTMLENDEMKKKYNVYLDNIIALSVKELQRNENEPDIRRLAAYYHNTFCSLKKQFNETYEQSIVKAFKRFQDLGSIELITCAATHAFLPYIKTEQGLRTQIENAVKLHICHFNQTPKGIWLPECGYVEDVEKVLASYGITYFFTDTHTIEQATPSPKYGVYQPVRTGNGVLAFGRDPDAGKQVWSSIEGYPGDHVYREYYKDIGYELDYDYIKPYLHKTGIRLNTGIKYWRITGNESKALYDPDRAEAKAIEHARHFVDIQINRVREIIQSKAIEPVLVAAYDTELFGHWWYEGPVWIEHVFRKLNERVMKTILPVTPVEYIRQEVVIDETKLAFSSWGKGGYGEVWLDHSNEWIYRHLHTMEERMIFVATKYGGMSELSDRALNQALRELMLAQSSDWAFIMHHRTVVDYAVKRIKNHIGRFNALCDRIEKNTLSIDWLKGMEELDNIFPNVDYVSFQNTDRASVTDLTKKRMKVLMLSWEYPPMTVGGLSRHVFDLARHLAMKDIEVHVITSHVEGYPSYEINQSVHVHRVPTLQAKELDFLEWIFQLNLAMADYVENMVKWFGDFDLVHAHDWLVGHAAQFLKNELKLPLVSTIHATEHGRNNGIHTPIQRIIHEVEANLARNSYKVIVCSDYMENEIGHLFTLPPDRIVTIPNGVDPSMVQVNIPDKSFRDRYALSGEKIVFFVGRLVQEKGVETLIRCVPLVLGECPEAKFVIAGKGPMLKEWLALVERMNLQHKVLFCGFVDDETRNQLLHVSSVAVFPSYYEPFGIVALEAMAAGVPVVASGVGGLSEVITHGVDGYTVLPGNGDSLAGHIILALQNSNQVEEMVQNALFKVYTTYSWDRIASLAIDIYNRAITDVLVAR